MVRGGMHEAVAALALQPETERIDVMCFRPADANAPTSIECPNCGKKVNYTNGVLPKKCPFCKTPTSELEAMAAGAQGAPGAAVSGAPATPQTAKAPVAPGAPATGAPAAPQAPGAPKPPVA